MRRKMMIKGMAVMLALALAACSDWVRVSPKTSVESRDLFKTEVGFKSALIGLYSRMTLPETYGKNMSYGHLEQLAQRYDNYDVSNAPADDQRAEIYDYRNNRDAKVMVKALWLENFRTVANINSLLAHLEKEGKSVVLTSGYWELMKGEALGLRAFHYFDLLRLFGPVYKEHPELKCLPWRTAFDAGQKVLLPAEEIVRHILDDLEEAEELLKHDPLNYGIDQDDYFLGLRKHRMNRMAVKALAARVYLWTGDRENAARKAREVIGECGLELVGNNAEDVSMYGETLFCLGVDKMKEKFRSDWADLKTYSNELYISEENARTVFEYREGPGVNDIRYKNGYGFIHGENGLMCRKYLGENVAYAEKLPLIRLSEMYYILAEAEQDASWINKVRNARGISGSLDVGKGENYGEEQLIADLCKEYQKEYFAEGQWFYFLKRHHYPTFWRCPLEKMEVKNYVLPTPDDEIEYGIEAK